MGKPLSERISRNFYRIVMYASAALIVALSLFAVVASLYYGYDVVGEILVNLPTKEPFEFPQPELFPIYAKPVSWLYVALVAFWFTFLEVHRDRLSRVRPGILQFAKLVAFVATAIAAYEVYYNFTIWGSLMAYQAITGYVNPDVLANTFPNPNTPWNLVFATKFFSAIVVISVYTLYFIMRIERR